MFLLPILAIILLFIVMYYTEHNWIKSNMIASIGNKNIYILLLSHMGAIHKFPDQTSKYTHTPL